MVTERQDQPARTGVVHLPHPSGGNGGGTAVFCDDREPNPNEAAMLECRRQVLPAVEAALRGTA